MGNYERKMLNLNLGTLPETAILAVTLTRVYIPTVRI